MKIKLELCLLLVAVALVGQSSQTSTPMSDQEVQSCILHFNKDLKSEAPDVAKQIEIYLRDENPELKDLSVEQLIKSKKPTRICGGLIAGDD